MFGYSLYHEKASSEGLGRGSIEHSYDSVLMVGGSVVLGEGCSEVRLWSLKLTPRARHYDP